MMASNPLILHSFVMQAADSGSAAGRQEARPEQRVRKGIQNRAAENIVFDSTQTISSEFFSEFVIKSSVRI